MNQYEKNSLIATLEAALTYAKRIPATRDCGSCAYADMGGGPLRCKYANAYPPKEVIENGCEAYFFDKNSPPF